MEQPVLYEGSLAYSPEALLFKNRIIQLNTDVNPQSTTKVKNMLLVLDRLKYRGKEHDDIILYIDSPGGMVTSGLGIYDTMQAIESDVVTICTGMAASMGSLLLMAGARGKRFALPNSTIMVHELSGGKSGKLHDMTVSPEYYQGIMDRLASIYIKHMPRNGQGLIDRWGGDTQAESVSLIKPCPMDDKAALDWFKRWAQRDRFMVAEQALAWGHIDGIIGRLPGDDNPPGLEGIIGPSGPE